MTIHNKGGKDTPYEKYHLTDNQQINAVEAATAEHDGIFDKECVPEITYVGTPPASNIAAGKKGQRYMDNDYLYICIEDNKWVRINLPYSTFVINVVTTEDGAALMTEDGNILTFEGV